MSRIELPSFATARVLVVGDVMLDRYWYGDATRISPEAPVPVVDVNHSEVRPGGAANVAVNVTALGAGAVLVGLTGEDEAGARLDELMREHGVARRFQRIEGFDTVTKMRVISRHQQLVRIDIEGRLPGRHRQDLLDDMRRALDGVGAVVLSDYGKGALAGVQDYIACAREAGIPVFVDPKGTDFEKYRGASVITPNLAEFEAAWGACRDLDELEARAQDMVSTLGLEALLVTRGEQGMSLFRAGMPPMHRRAHALEVFDVTGAGDTVIGVLAATAAAGRDLAHGMELANIAAGIVVAKLGTASASRREIEQHIDAGTVVNRGVVSEQELLAAVERAREEGMTIVMTNGCFDLLHAGHVAYLQEARALGDCLVVAVNDDSSVRRLKGAARPINTAEDRMAVMAALASVDWVVPFAEDTPRALIGRVAPDILVKGGDYSPTEIAGHDEVVAGGGRVEILPFRRGFSTSAIIDGIVALNGAGAKAGPSGVIVVTGGAGFIGSNIVRAFVMSGDDVLVVDDLSDGTKFTNLVDSDIHDYRDKAAFLDAIAGGDEIAPEPSVVIHQGACSDTTEWDGRYMLKNNFEYSRVLFEYCARRSIPFLYASSAAVYGDGREFGERPENEHPLNVYGFSKLLFDRYVRRRLPGLKSQVAGFRYFNVYGPGEAHKGAMASVAYHLHCQLGHGDKVRLFEGCDGYGPGEQRRDFVFVRDVVAVTRWFVEHPECSGIFNVGSGRSQSFNDVARAVIEWHGRGEIEYIPFPRHLRGRYQSYTRAELGALREAGYPGAFAPVESGVPAYLDELKQQRT